MAQVQRFQFMESWLSCFWASDETEHHGGKCVVKQNFSLGDARRQREGISPRVPFKGKPPTT